MVITPQIRLSFQPTFAPSTRQTRRAAKKLKKNVAKLTDIVSECPEELNFAATTRQNGEKSPH